MLVGTEKKVQEEEQPSWPSGGPLSPEDMKKRQTEDPDVKWVLEWKRKGDKTDVEECVYKGAVWLASQTVTEAKSKASPPFKSHLLGKKTWSWS